jgi:hypothetical protein
MLLTLSLAVLPVVVRAAGEPQLRLTADKLKVKVGKEVTVEVRIENAPEIRGVDVHLTFDPALLEVVDADKDAAGVQVKPGKFLDPDKSSFLQHQVDNEAGTIDYALVVLNPAPPAEGNGVLMKITFRGKADGLATISIAEGAFGAPTGDTIQPTLDQVSIAIGHAPTPTPAPAVTQQTPDMGSSPPSGLPLLAGGLAVAGLAGVGGGSWFWLKRIRRG